MALKPFLTYEQQIKYLLSKKLNITNEDSAKEILANTSYFALINGYKQTFKNPVSHDFIDEVDFLDIYKLYQFDASLREIFLKYILIFEKHIKSSLSYHFTSLYGNGIAYYQNIDNYDYGNSINDVNKLFRKMNRKLKSRYTSPQVTHYMQTYQDVPLWVLTTDLTMGEIAAMFRYLKGSCKTNICNDFGGMGRSELGKMLIILTKYRNVCAHGNRLFNCHIQDSILDSSIHAKMHIIKKADLYQYGKSDLFAAVISLKYLLTPEEFHQFYYELKKIIKKFDISRDILEIMGFPNNWMSILRIRV